MQKKGEINWFAVLLIGALITILFAFPFLTKTSEAGKSVFDIFDDALGGFFGEKGERAPVDTLKPFNEEAVPRGESFTLEYMYDSRVSLYVHRVHALQEYSKQRGYHLFSDQFKAKVDTLRGAIETRKYDLAAAIIKDDLLTEIESRSQESELLRNEYQFAKDEVLALQRAVEDLQTPGAEVIDTLALQITKQEPGKGWDTKSLKNKKLEDILSQYDAGRIQLDDSTLRRNPPILEDEESEWFFDDNDNGRNDGEEEIPFLKDVVKVIINDILEET